MKKNNTILVLPFSHTLSHLSRPLVVSKHLKENGHKIIYGAGSPKTGFIEDEGFEVLPSFEPDPDLLFSNIRSNKIRFVSDETIEKMIASDIALIEQTQPDLILSDGRFSVPVSAQVCGIKHAGIVNASSTDFRAIPYLPVEKIPFYASLDKKGGQKAIHWALLKFEMAVFDNVMNVFKRLSRKYGLGKTVTATNCLEGVDLTLLADVPEYFPTKNLPGNYHYIGPLTWKPSGSVLPEWWPPEKKGGKLIYISMGTTGLGDFFSMVFDLFKDLDYKIVMTTGAQSDKVKSIPGRLYVEPFIDGDKVMEVADLVVCHGGNGTIYQALSHGRPVVGIPTLPDQAYNMRMVERLGLGTLITWQAFFDNPGILLEKVKQTLDCRDIVKRTRAFSSILQGYGRQRRSLDLIEDLLKS